MLPQFFLTGSSLRRCSSTSVPTTLQYSATGLLQYMYLVLTSNMVAGAGTTVDLDLLLVGFLATDSCMLVQLQGRYVCIEILI